jgi:excisionase family DNA binding protein
VNDERLDRLLAALRPLVAELVTAELDRRHASDPESPFLTVEQASTYLGASRQRVYDLCSDGRLRRYRDGTRLLVRRDEIDAYLTDGGRRQA